MSDLLLSGSHMDMFNKARRAKHALARALACALLGCCPATSPSDFVVQGIGQCSLWKSWNGRSTLVPVLCVPKFCRVFQTAVLTVESKPPNGQNGDQDAG